MEDTLCVKGFCRVFCINAIRYRNVRYRCAKNLTWVQTPGVGRAPTDYGLLAIQWLNAFILTCVERLSNREVFHLPNSYTKGEIILDYARQQVRAGDSHICYSYFCKLWHKEFSNVKIPRSNQFSVCEDCETFKRNLQNARTTAAQGMTLQLFFIFSSTNFVAADLQVSCLAHEVSTKPQKFL